MRRATALLQSGYQCADCGLIVFPHERHVHILAYQLEVHHLTYIRLGNEREDDLCVLCKECHMRRHKRYLPAHYYETFPRPWNKSSDEGLSDYIGEDALDEAFEEEFTNHLIDQLLRGNE